MNGSQRNSKGKNFERFVSKELSKAFKTSVNRVPASGAWRGSDTDYNAAHEDNRLLGDVFFPLNHPMNIFNIELKNHARVKLRSFFTNATVIQDFMNQVTTDAHRKVGYSVPILICHVSREDDYLVIPYTDEFYFNLVKKEMPVARIQLTSKDDMVKQVNKYDCILTNLKAFMSFSVHDLVTWYKDIDWDFMNKEKVVEDTSSVEIEDALDVIGKKISGDNQ